MLRSKEVHDWGRVYFPWGAGTQFRDLITEVDEYFRHGIEVKPGDVVFDVGANIGSFALLAARRAGGGLSFHCFEPIPEIREALIKNFESNELLRRSTKKLHPLGLTAFGAPAVATFDYFKRLPCDTTQHPEEKRGEFERFFALCGASVERRVRRVMPGALGRWVARGLGRFVSRFTTCAFTGFFFERAIGRTRIECPLATLQSIVENEHVDRIDLLKVDVEGAELEVLQGIEAATWGGIRQIVMEGHDQNGRLAAIEGLLVLHGFDRIVSEVPPLAVERGLNNFILYARRSDPAASWILRRGRDSNPR